MEKDKACLGSILLLLLACVIPLSQRGNDQNYVEGKKIIDGFFGYDEGYVVRSRDCERVSRAVHFLKRAIDSEPRNGKAYVYLKRALELKQRCIQAMATHDFQGTDKEIQVALKSVDPQIKAIEK